MRQEQWNDFNAWMTKNLQWSVKEHMRLCERYREPAGIRNESASDLAILRPPTKPPHQTDIARIRRIRDFRMAWEYNVKQMMQQQEKEDSEWALKTKNCEARENLTMMIEDEASGEGPLFQIQLNKTAYHDYLEPFERDQLQVFGVDIYEEMKKWRKRNRFVDIIHLHTTADWRYRDPEDPRYHDVLESYKKLLDLDYIAWNPTKRVAPDGTTLGRASTPERKQDAKHIKDMQKTYGTKKLKLEPGPHIWFPPPNQTLCRSAPPQLKPTPGFEFCLNMPKSHQNMTIDTYPPVVFICGIAECRPHGYLLAPGICYDCEYERQERLYADRYG